MHFIVTQPINNSLTSQHREQLQYAFSDPTVAPVVRYGLRRNCPLKAGDKALLLLPEQWCPQSGADPQTVYHNGRFCFQDIIAEKGLTEKWISISNARYVTQCDDRQIESLLTTLQADLLAVFVDPSLAGNDEKFIYTSAGHVGGFCRMYSDSILPGKEPTDWPHLLFVNRAVFERVFSDGSMPLKFNEFYAGFKVANVTTRSVRMGGCVRDLLQQNGLLQFILSSLNKMHPKADLIFHDPANKVDVPDSVRVYGRVLVGENVRIGNDVVLVGPMILCNNVLLADKSVIKTSIIGPGHFSGKGPLIRKDTIDLGQSRTDLRTPEGPVDFTEDIAFNRTHGGQYRKWQFFSYPFLFKRMADFIVALTVLILLAPLFPLIAIAIKLTSSGPVFFGHKRQGLHAKEFYCLKFRTMIPGADNIQDKLRSKNQVDGPQFKIEDDPRVTAVGRFLRNTYIDEIPQFINVLKGQMSLIGPRPSPQKENSLCPVWHDARLSVRPGITGLWQIKRTRQPGQDFQEWIYYDIEYIRRLSPKMDIHICWETIKKIASNFFSQF